MRNPNGYGGISKMSGKRRKPYRVRVTEKIEDGKQTYKDIGYYATKKEALDALAEYNKTPDEFIAKELTFKDVYEAWKKEKYVDITLANRRVMDAAYNTCCVLDDVPMKNIKAAQLQEVVDKSGKNEPSRGKIKVMLSQVFKYAEKNDIVNKNYAKFIVIRKDEDESYKIIRSPFTEDEIQKLWDNLDKYPWIDTILIMIYTSLRIEGLLSAKTENVHLDERYLRAGVKTEAGKDRIIPIHDRIFPLIEKRFEEGRNLLITDNGHGMRYKKYRSDYFDAIMMKFNMEHLPHDCRHTFESRANSAGMNKVCIDRIMGHASKDIGERVYTHKTIEELVEEVNKLS